MKIKKKVTLLMGVLLIALVSAFNLSITNQNEGIPLVSLANIEALAGSECDPTPSPCAGPKNNGECQSTNCINCKDNSGCQ